MEAEAHLPSQLEAQQDELKDIKDFADVYLGFVYRLAIKQYEADYQEMRALIREPNSHQGYLSQGVKERALQGGKLKVSRGDSSAKPANSHRLPGVTGYERLPARSVERNDKLADAGNKGQSHTVLTDDIEEADDGRKPRSTKTQLDTPSTAVGGAPGSHAGFGSKNGYLVRPAPTTSKGNPAVPRVGENGESASDNYKFIKEAEVRKRQLQKELTLLEVNIMQAKNKSKLPKVNQPSRQMLPEVDVGRTRERTQLNKDKRGQEELSVESKGDQAHNYRTASHKADRDTSFERYSALEHTANKAESDFENPAVGYGTFEGAGRLPKPRLLPPKSRGSEPAGYLRQYPRHGDPRVVDNAEFIQMLNREKKEREVCCWLCSPRSECRSAELERRARSTCSLLLRNRE